MSETTTPPPSAKRSWLTPPPLIQKIFAKFPLVTYPSTDTFTDLAAPSKPTLWVLGSAKGKNTDREPSFDVRSLRWQAALKFAEVDCEFKYWENEDCGIGGELSWVAECVGSDDLAQFTGLLPCLHLPDGTLIGHDGLEKWLESKKSHGNGKEQEEDTSIQSRIWYSLVENKLYPGLVSSCFPCSAR